jgi:hypothetical protein
MNITRGLRRLSLLGTGVLAAGVLSGGAAPRIAHAQAAASSGTGVASICPQLEELVSGQQAYATNAGQVLRLDPPAPQGTLTTGTSLFGSPYLDVPLDMAFLPGGDIVVTDAGYNSGVKQVVQVNKTTGDTKLISSNTKGTGPVLNIPRAVAVEASGDILVADDYPYGGWASRILRIDPATGNRTLLSGASRGSGPAFAPDGVYLTIAGGVIYAVDRAGEIMSVDPVTGDRTEVSGASRGVGPMVDGPMSITAGPTGELAVLELSWASGTGVASLIQVTLATGDRTVLSSNAQNPSGPDAEFGAVMDVQYDGCQQAYYVMQSGLFSGTLLTVKAESGVRTFLTSFAGDSNNGLLIRTVLPNPIGSGGAGAAGK